MGNDCYNSNNKNNKIYNTHNTYIGLVSKISKISQQYKKQRETLYNKRSILRLNNLNNCSPFHVSFLEKDLIQTTSPKLDKIHTISPLFLMKGGSSYNSPINNISTLIRIENYIDSHIIDNNSDINDIINDNNSDINDIENIENIDNDFIIM